jgi:hypothetical protein
LVPLDVRAQQAAQELRGATMRRRVPQPQGDARATAECLQEPQGGLQEDVPQVLQAEWVLPPGRQAQQPVSPLLEPEAWRGVLSGPLALRQEPEAPARLVLQWG